MGVNGPPPPHPLSGGPQYQPQPGSVTSISVPDLDTSSPSLSTTLQGLHSNIVSLAASIEEIHQKSDLALVLMGGGTGAALPGGGVVGEVLRLGEEVMGVRATVQGLRMQMHGLMMGNVGVGTGAMGFAAGRPPPQPQVLNANGTNFEEGTTEGYGMPPHLAQGLQNQRKPAKTPIIAGSICGAVLLIAWIVGFVIYFRKRANRKKRKRMAEEGLCEPPPEKVNPTRSSSERIVIPPDPAVILGYAKPGETVHVPREKSSSKTPPHSRSHSRSQSTASVKQQIPTPSRPAPLAKTKSHGHHHKKSLSHSSSKSRPSSPKKAEGDDETAPLNPHVNDSPQL
ncbi:hypothetical protein MD484_g2624, partial [Candolleomyces efflorescens]